MCSSRSEHYYRVAKLLEYSAKYVDPVIATCVDKALSGKPIDDHECLAILREQRPLELKILELAADYARWLNRDDIVTFVVNRNINFTNVCVLKCRFCAFSVPPSSPKAYVLSMSQVREKVREALSFGITEVCVQGAINPSLDLDYYVKLLRTIKEEAPHVHIHGFSPQEIHYLSVKTGLSYREILLILREAGLGSMPGTAAEILDDDVRKILCPGKISVKTWIEIVKTAHKLGIRSSATIMYGHIERDVHIVKHFRILREIQQETRGFTELVLLPFVHQRTDIYRVGLARPGSTGVYDAKICVAARLYFNNIIPNIQVSWVKLGRKLAQYLLTCGANDLGGTLIEENISHAAGASEEVMLTRKDFIYLIRESGRVPAERTTLYKIVRVYGT